MVVLDRQREKQRYRKRKREREREREITYLRRVAVEAVVLATVEGARDSVAEAGRERGAEATTEIGG